MYTLFAYLSRLFRPSATTADYSAQLMEQAVAHFGRSPQQAAELRRAAAAWLRVVR